jgi:hypothetical protein
MVSFGFGPIGLSRVTVNCLGEGRTPRETFARIDLCSTASTGSRSGRSHAKEAAAEEAIPNLDLRPFSNRMASVGLEFR